MKSRTTARFRQSLRSLPPHVRRQAISAYRLFVSDPYHPSLHFKRVHATRLVYSARISRDYRVLGLREDETMLWFWIGTHADYDKLLTQL